MKKLFTLIALVLVLTMMPFALFSCNDDSRPSKRGDGASTESKDTDGTDDGIRCPWSGHQYLLYDL